MFYKLTAYAENVQSKKAQCTILSRTLFWESTSALILPVTCNGRACLEIQSDYDQASDSLRQLQSASTERHGRKFWCAHKRPASRSLQSAVRHMPAEGSWSFQQVSRCPCHCLSRVIQDLCAYPPTDSFFTSPVSDGRKLSSGLRLGSPAHLCTG